MDKETADRIAGRKWAEECLEFAFDQSPDFVEGFRRQIKRVLAGDLTPADTMTEQEAISFEAETIAFGKFSGSNWGSIPVEYIAWLADNSQRLLKYVRSDRFNRRKEFE